MMGCGDVGRRIVKILLSRSVTSSDITAYVRTVKSAETCANIGVMALRLDLDNLQRDLSLCTDSELYYTIAPQKSSVTDDRTRALLSHFEINNIRPRRVVVVSTTGVYGDCSGKWVNELTPTEPQTDRGKRRLDSEQQWLRWGKQHNTPVRIMRVPGIYAFSRIPRKRLMNRTPVVRAEECGFTNRIHADDLAAACITAMESGGNGEIYNVTDGTPGKISEYLQLAAHVLGMEPLPEISMEEGQRVLSQGMLSYLSESRKISNQKMLDELGIKLKHPDFKQGIKY